MVGPVHMSCNAWWLMAKGQRKRLPVGLVMGADAVGQALCGVSDICEARDYAPMHFFCHPCSDALK